MFLHNFRFTNDFIYRIPCCSFIYIGLFLQITTKQHQKKNRRWVYREKLQPNCGLSHQFQRTNINIKPGGSDEGERWACVVKSSLSGIHLRICLLNEKFSSRKLDWFVSVSNATMLLKRIVWKESYVMTFSSETNMHIHTRTRASEWAAPTRTHHDNLCTHHLSVELINFAKQTHVM